MAEGVAPPRLGFPDLLVAVAILAALPPPVWATHPVLPLGRHAAPSPAPPPPVACGAPVAPRRGVRSLSRCWPQHDPGSRHAPAADRDALAHWLRIAPAPCTCQARLAIPRWSHNDRSGAT